MSTNTKEKAEKLSSVNIFGSYGRVSAAVDRKTEIKSEMSLYRGKVEKLTHTSTGKINLTLREVETAANQPGEPKWKPYRGKLIFTFMTANAQVDIYEDVATITVRTDHERWEAKILPREEESTD